MKEIFQDVNQTAIKSFGQVWVDIENNNTSKQLPILILKNNSTLFLCKLVETATNYNKPDLTGRRNEPIRAHIPKFKKLFQTSHTIKNA